MWIANYKHFVPTGLAVRLKKLPQVGQVRTGNPRSNLAILLLLIVALAACGKNHKPETAGEPNKDSGSKPSSIDAAEIINRHRALDNSHDSTSKMRVSINNTQGAESNGPRQLQLTMFRKHEPEERLRVLIEFTAPPEERDRDGLISVFADGRIEAVRYVQSTDSFIVVNDPMSEDALFGLTAQELAEGQPEKYDFAALGEEAFEGTPVYRLEGRLKRGAESKFPRLVMLISKQNSAALKAEFYDNRDQLARRLTVLKSEQIAGHWTRTRWRIENLARGKTLDFEAVDVKYDQNLSDSIFTREHLKKIASR